jgi:ABC-type ATPase with predicted acetyltransferase domain
MFPGKDLWTCPQCGHQFVTANMWHSCGSYDLDGHFRGKDPQVRELFDALVEVIEGIGPVTVYVRVRPGTGC